MKTYRLVSLGCKVNAYEVDAVASLLRLDGYRPVLENENPTLIIINTCAVTEKSEKKSRQLIRKEIRENPDSIIAVMGCFSEIRPKVVQSIKGVHIIVGTAYRSKIPELVKTYQKDLMPKYLFNHRRAKTYEEFGVPIQSHQTRAYVKIQDGCNNFCSYCLIPFARGKSRSREIKPIIEEVKALVEDGHLEIVLTGINTGTYGKDLTNGVSLAKLLQILLKEVPGLARIRLSSIEVGEIDAELIALLAKEPRLARHLHIPLQSGSDGVLKRMKRPYLTKDFKDKILSIRKAVPNIAITTDVIVGFPMETKDEFLETVHFIKDLGFSRLHVFPFSSRSMTDAERLPHHIDEKTKKDRVHTLLKLNQELVHDYEEAFTNQTVSAIFEEYDEKCDLYLGHSSNYLPVKVRSETNLIGKLVVLTYHPVICNIKKVNDNQ